jgi:16S rRNA (guanine1207-N2)-methyltransferase
MSAGQYFEREPAAPSRPRSVSLTLPDLTVELVTDSAVFSADRIDRGTKYLLLEGPTPPDGARHLADLGCGYGPIAVALARRAPGATIWAIDVNPRALELCATNAARLGLDNVRCIDPAGAPDDLVLDALYSNPPIRVGKPVLHELLVTWLARLAPAGSAHLVVQKHLGSDSLARWLTDQGWPVVRRGSRAGYRLLDVTRTAGPTPTADGPHDDDNGQAG